MAKNVKKRNWAFVLYPESAPEDWQEQLSQTGLTFCVSPLHDKDIDPTGQPKKAHYHVILCYSGPTSFNVVNSLCQNLNQPIPQALEQVKGYYRYLTHMDNPDKYQYDEKDIKAFNGFNILDYSELTRSEVHQIKIKIQGIIRECELFEYGQLMDFLLDNDLLTEHEVACNHTMFFDRYISSRRHHKISVIKKDMEDKALQTINDINGSGYSDI